MSEPLIANGAWSKVAVALLGIIFAAGQAVIFDAQSKAHYLAARVAAIEANRFTMRDGASTRELLYTLSERLGRVEQKLATLPPAQIEANSAAIAELFRETQAIRLRIAEEH